MAGCYADESQIGGTGSTLPYVLVATLVPHYLEDELRDLLAQALPRGAKKLHWNQMNRAEQCTAIQRLLALPLRHVAALNAPTRKTKPERLRRGCLEVLSYVLEQAGVDRVTFESRGAADDAADLKMLAAMRSRRIVGGELHFDHAPGPSEPLLWIPDIVCGALGRSIRLNEKFEFQSQTATHRART